MSSDIKFCLTCGLQSECRKEQNKEGPIEKSSLGHPSIRMGWHKGIERIEVLKMS